VVESEEENATKSPESRGLPRINIRWANTIHRNTQTRHIKVLGLRSDSDC